MAKILMVDDSKFMRDRVIKALSKDGHEVIEAADGAVGLEMVAKLDGIEFLSRLRAGGSRLPVVVLTADIQVDTQALCKDLGASRFLPKPPRGEELCRTVAELLSGTRGGVECA
jgi:two-component system chemotaxis response regulator CheY